MTTISILLPARGRPSDLSRSVDSLLGMARRPDKIQVCYATDADDQATADVVEARLRPGDLHLVMPSQLGYDRLHEYCNAMLGDAVGDWFLMWNDDAFMKTQYWDDVVFDADPQTILDPLTSMGDCGLVLFPVVPATFVRAVGHWSLNAHTDTWWQEIGQTLGIIKRVDIMIEHQPTPSQYGKASRQFYEPHARRLRAEDTETIRGLL